MTFVTRIIFAAALIVAVPAFAEVGPDASEIKDLAARTESLNDGVRTLIVNAEHVDAGAYATELKRLEREAEAISSDATDLGVDGPAKSMKAAASSLKTVRKNVEGDPRYVDGERADDTQERLKKLEASTDQTVKDLQGLASGRAK